jgi:hypothetical protein
MVATECSSVCLFVLLCGIWSVSQVIRFHAPFYTYGESVILGFVIVKMVVVPVRIVDRCSSVYLRRTLE